MGNIAAQRGGTGLLESIQRGAKRISDHNPLIDSLQFDKPMSSQPDKPVSPSQVIEGGAAYTIRNMGARSAPPVSRSLQSSKPSLIIENYSEKAFLNHLLESVSTLGSTKEYFNALNSLFTLYAMGNLTEGVLDSISRGDLREIKGILKDFSSLLESY